MLFRLYLIQDSGHLHCCCYASALFATNLRFYPNESSVVIRIGIRPFEKRIHAIFKGRASSARVVLVVIYPEAVPDIPPHINLKLPDPELGSRTSSSS